MKDDLGQRMKDQYENRTRVLLPRRTYSIIRIDGKAFHTYTRKLKKPFDHDLSRDIDMAVIKLLEEVQGAQFAYCQSDEISILLTDFEKNNTNAWFDGNIQKITSVSASIMTAEFNSYRHLREHNKNFRYGDTTDLFLNGYFDARVFTIPDRTEVMNYFIWRNQDCCRNSISMVAQSMFSSKELHGKNSSEMQEMIFQKSGVNWADYPAGDKNGRLILKKYYDCLGTMRSAWESAPAWKFTEDKETLKTLIPKNPNEEA